MKKYLFALLLTMIGVSSVKAIAQDKVYISSKDIMIAENGIFIKSDGYAGTVDSLHHDDDGIYITPKMDWVCEKGHIVFWWQGTSCPYCYPNG